MSIFKRESSINGEIGTTFQPFMIRTNLYADPSNLEWESTEIDYIVIMRMNIVSGEIDSKSL